MSYDMLVTGGMIFDPQQKSFVRADVAVADGKVARIAASLSGAATEVIDAAGLIVTPGLIDLHVHSFRLVHYTSIDADRLAPRAGTTTMVDAGSSGWLNFEAFRQFILDRSQLNLLAFLNISMLGQCFATQMPHVPVVHEYDDPRLVHVGETVKCIEAHRDRIVGVKVRAHKGQRDLTPIHAALDAARATHLPLMIHTAPPPPADSQYMHLLRPGDIVTHLYHPQPGSLIDDRGRIRPEYAEARARGVIMDTGFDRIHIDFEVLRRAVGEGFWPDTISTDVTTGDIEYLVYDVLFTASKFLALGMPLADVLVAMTIAPARAIRRPELAQLTEGGAADIAVLELREEQLTFEDFFGHSLQGRQRLVCRKLIRKGKLFTGPS